MMAVLPQLVLAQRRVRCEVSGLQEVLVGTDSAQMWSSRSSEMYWMVGLGLPVTNLAVGAIVLHDAVNGTIAMVRQAQQE